MYQIGKEEVKLSLFTDDQEFIRINKFSKITRQKINRQKLYTFLCINNELLKNIKNHYMYENCGVEDS